MNNRMIWKNYSLDTAARLISGRTPDRDKKEYYAAKGTPWVKIENLNRGVIMESTEYLSEQGREKVNLVPKNSVLFSIVGTVGKVGIAGRELATNQQIVALIFDEQKIDPLFGYYCMKYHAEDIRKLSDQTTMALINRKTLGQYRILVPESLEEQKKIAQRLQKFENYCNKKELQLKKFQAYEQVLFQKIFHDEILYHERLKMGDFLREPVSGGVPKNEEPETDYPRLTPQDFEWSYIRDPEQFGIDEDENKKNSAMYEDMDYPDRKYQIQEGDILLRNGNIILADEQKRPVFMDRSILCLRTSCGQLLPEVLYGYMNLPEIKGELYTERKTGGNRKRPIRGSELERMDMPYFTMELQLRYQECLRKVRTIQKLLDREIIVSWKAFHAVSECWLHGPRKEPQKNEKTEIEPEGIFEENPIEDSFMEESVLFTTTPAKETMQNILISQQEEQSSICHLILAVLAGWCPENDGSGRYAAYRQEIFKKAQKMFQPVALSFVTAKGQEEYLLERDFLMYRSRILSERWEEPLAFLREVLEQKEAGEIVDAHLAFPGEEGIRTEKDWDLRMMKEMAKEAWFLFARYSGFGICDFLL